MKSLLEVVKDPTLRPRVVQDATALIDSEVARKGGLTGMALKGGYKVVKKLKGGRMIPDAVDHLLDEFSGAIEPLHAEYREAEDRTGGFEGFLRTRDRRAADALLAITDRRAERSDNRILVGTYRKLRPTAIEHVREALPGVGRMIDRYAAA